MSLKIPKLKDCKHHFGDRSQYADETMIFLTEGDSAAGSMVSSRNVLTQAIFSLKGKPMNCFGEKIDKVYSNEELYYIMKTLNVEEDIDDLRYAKVVIATDSDVDGLHIRNLLITYFLTFFEQLVSKGHVYILETPLFRVRNKKETIYCYDEEERDEAVKKLGSRSAEVTRFKGLGEISPSEFGQFIGEDIRLVKVTIDNSKGIAEMLKFYMGDNTPNRREHIMKNLV
jgi:DNA gyrase/topoisomerase IV subunit B